MRRTEKEQEEEWDVIAVQVNITALMAARLEIEKDREGVREK